MKKENRKATDDLRLEYTRSDFGKLVRGKYAARLVAGTTVIVLEPDQRMSTKSLTSDATSLDFCAFRA
ncbi:MAG: hypothetical protein LZF86_40031 [Nitrospira sp.]|nr:MAG: hypothetical protein LZF86_40031 [Nitrospira sp.]